MLKLLFEVEVFADTQAEIDEAYEAMISAAINVSNSLPTACVCVMAPSEGSVAVESV